MKRAVFIFIIMISSTFRVFATIINIPADYPAIQQGIDASSDGDTVLVQPGTYVENINFNGHSIVLGSLFLMTGDATFIENTIIDGNYNASVITLINEENSTTIICGFTIQNGYSNHGAGIETFQSTPLIKNNIIRDNFAIVGGGAIDCFHANSRVANNFIINNSAVYKGGAIYCSFSDVLISNNVFIENSTKLYGGGIACYSSNSLIINNTIYRNTAPSGGGLACWGVSRPRIVNMILWQNIPNHVYVDGPANPDITFSLVQDGWPGEGNIDADPLFRDPENGDFHLMSIACGDQLNSPSIDTGDPALIDSLLNCDWGLGTERSDMGAYAGGDSATVAIDDLIDKLPKRFALLQNYPNPFNASTIIRYTLPEQADVKIEIYNILGQKAAVLFDGNQSTGYHSVTWHADDFPSGIYLARLAAGTVSKNIKMILLK